MPDARTPRSGPLTRALLVDTALAILAREGYILPLGTHAVMIAATLGYGLLLGAGVPVRGGDTTRADRVLLSVTALGRSDRVPGRAGARPGDAIVVTGGYPSAGRPIYATDVTAAANVAMLEATG